MFVEKINFVGKSIKYINFVYFMLLPCIYAGKFR